jgi:hypothetical protein
MVTFNTLLLIGMIAAGVASVATVAFFMLLGCYLGIKEMKKRVKEAEDEDESGVFTIPMSALGNMGGGGRPVTQADVDRARAQMAQMSAAQGGAPGGCPDSGCTDKKEEKPALGGQYL